MNDVSLCISTASGMIGFDNLLKEKKEHVFVLKYREQRHLEKMELASMS